MFTLHPLRTRGYRHVGGSHRCRVALYSDYSDLGSHPKLDSNLKMMDCLDLFLLREDGEELRRAYDGDGVPIDWKPTVNKT
jgi:hypothetical protein